MLQIIRTPIHLTRLALPTFFSLQQIGCGLAVLGLTCRISSADTVVLTPVADTTLIEAVPNNNLGGQLFANAGTTQNFTKNRACFRFDLSGNVPQSATITSAKVVFEVTKQPVDGYTPAPFGLHRVLRAWGEGDKTAAEGASPGLGAPATTNEATWIHRFAFTTNTWASPGGAPTIDFAELPSATVYVYGVGDSPYAFGPTAEMVGDVQYWLGHPESNFGWMLICQTESENFTARRFGSRENATKAPLLTIEFTLPPRIERVQHVDNQIQLVFTAQADRTNAVEFGAVLRSGSWSTLTNFPPAAIATNRVAIDPVSQTQRFYRVVVR
jgi:hypothetical protein